MIYEINAAKRLRLRIQGGWTCHDFMGSRNGMII